MSFKYPLTPCLHPQKVYNKYIKRTLTVGCGKCEACLQRKSIYWTNLNNIMGEDFYYCMFVTLTYNNDSIPSLSPFVVMYDNGNKFVHFKCNFLDRLSDKTRFSEQGFLLNDDLNFYYHTKQTDDLDYLAKFVDKVNMHGDIPVLNKQDLQKFFKRFRYYCKKYGIKESFKTYSVGEYGPQHYRPHFHVLFYFNSKQLFLSFKQILYQSWKYGYTDFSLSRGGTANYVAKYLNSIVGIPEFFKNKAIKPFNLHSSCFSLSFYEHKKKEIYRNDLRRIINHVRPVCGKEQSISLWRSFTSRFFPKVRCFNESDNYFVYRLFTAYPFACQYFGETIISNIIPLILSNNLDYFVPLIFDFVGNIKSLRSYEQIEHDLYISKHFFVFCCDSKWENTCSRISVIKKFYSLYELSRLRDFYQSQVNNPQIDWHAFYDDFNFPVDTLDEYKVFRSFTSDKSNFFIKHKKQNDLNKMFVAYE